MTLNLVYSSIFFPLFSFFPLLLVFLRSLTETDSAEVWKQTWDHTVNNGGADAGVVATGKFSPICKDPLA